MEIVKMDKEKADNKLLPNTGNERQPKKIHSVRRQRSEAFQGSSGLETSYPNTSLGSVATLGMYIHSYNNFGSKFYLPRISI